MLSLHIHYYDYNFYSQFLAALKKGAHHHVYVQPEGFESFIRGGGNLPLYEQLSSHLSRIYADYSGLRLLDVGAGDGYALLPALNAHVAHVDIIEPAAAMLGNLQTAMKKHPMTFTAYNITIQEFIPRTDQHTRWEVAQATFSLQSLTPSERRDVLTWLRGHCNRLLIAEFDVPEFSSPLSPEYVRYVMRTFQQGSGEYPVESPVARGFMMPVMFGYFDRTTARLNYEQPAASWQQELQQAGFTSITQTPLYDYWWAPAFLLDAG